MDALRQALRHFGYNSYGVILNRADFAHVSLPAIYCRGDHYTVLTKVTNDSITYIDPISETQPEITAPLPPLNDRNFSAALLVLRVPEIR